MHFFFFFLLLFLYIYFLTPGLLYFFVGLHNLANNKKNCEIDIIIFVSSNIKSKIFFLSKLFLFKCFF